MPKSSAISLNSSLYGASLGSSSPGFNDSNLVATFLKICRTNLPEYVLGAGLFMTCKEMNYFVNNLPNIWNCKHAVSDVWHKSGSQVCKYVYFSSITHSQFLWGMETTPCVQNCNRNDLNFKFSLGEHALAIPQQWLHHSSSTCWIVWKLVPTGLLCEYCIVAWNNTEHCKIARNNTEHWMVTLALFYLLCPSHAICPMFWSCHWGTTEITCTMSIVLPSL